MRALLRNVINNECSKHVERYFEYLSKLQDYAERRTRREGAPFSKKIKKPRWWSVAPQFNPFKVREQKRLETYAHALAGKIRARTYEPNPALVRYIVKPNGKRRVLNVFQIPDAAISNMVYKSVLKKNVNRLSAYAYAYREDRSSHDAVNDIFGDFGKLDRLYVAEFDFSRFFDEIDHEYLWRIIDNEGFVVSKEERHIIQAFLNSRSCEQNAYPAGAIARQRGIPQGSSISLFLANVACWELDRGLERLGVRFARYADDTLIWSDDYNKVVQAYYVINECAIKMGVPLNPEKSHGISLLSRIGKAEMATKDDVVFVGYQITLDRISIAKKKVAQIKSHIAYLAYQNLLQPLNRGIFNSATLSRGLDLDYVTALRQIRYYLYGGLTDEKLNQYLTGRISNLNFRGVMSYYPVVTDIDQLVHLDGWILYVLTQTLRKRQRMWLQYNGATLPGPTVDWASNLASFGIITTPSNTRVDLSIPSFRLVHRAMRVALERKGLSAVANPASRYYSG
jgi:RNA-directed DNA polymerase